MKAKQPDRRELRRQLMNAIDAVDLPRVHEIVALDASIVDAPSSHRNVPLAAAIETGSLELVELLLERGADAVHCNHGGRSHLEGAAFSGRADIARVLIAHGATPTVHHVAALGDLVALERALREDPRLLEATDAGGRWRMTPLHAAVLGGSLEAIEFLLECGAPVDALDHNEHTPLALIEACSSPEPSTIAERLLASGANPDARAGHHGGTLLHRAIMNGDEGLARLLLAHGAATDGRDWSGKTPLHHAVSRRRTLVELMLEFSPDLEIRDDNDETPLDLARRLKKRAVVDLLSDRTRS